MLWALHVAWVVKRFQKGPQLTHNHLVRRWFSGPLSQKKYEKQFGLSSSNWSTRWLTLSRWIKEKRWWAVRDASRKSCSTGFSRRTYCCWGRSRRRLGRREARMLPIIAPSKAPLANAAKGAATDPRMAWFRRLVLLQYLAGLWLQFKHVQEGIFGWNKWSTGLALVR